MSKLPSLKSREVIRILERAGFIFNRQRGSHRIFTKGNLSITVPIHNTDIKMVILKIIIKNSGLSVKEFLKLK